MIDSRIEPIATQDDATRAALLALNNAHARETSFLTPKKWRGLIDGAFAATCVGGGVALLIAFDPDADYDSPNFVWFRERLSRFVYIDRIIVAGTHRGAGLARLMYLDLCRRAQAAGHQRVVCEVNFTPRNRASDAFHAKMGFTEIGCATLPHCNKTVRYLAKPLVDAAV